MDSPSASDPSGDPRQEKRNPEDSPVSGEAEREGDAGDLGARGSRRRRPSPDAIDDLRLSIIVRRCVCYKGIRGWQVLRLANQVR
jgi:hypothetical protein